MYDWPGLLNPRFIAALVVAAALGCSGTLKRWARGTIESGTEMALAAAAGVVAATGLAEEMWSIVAHGPLVGAIGWMPQAWFSPTEIDSQLAFETKLGAEKLAWASSLTW